MLQTNGSNVLISINIVTWNSEAFIQPCLESIFNQTYKNFHVLVIDNASTDKTPEIVQGYRSRIEYFQLKYNTGFSHAHNIGFERAKGNYILVLNPDVVLTPTFLEKIVKVMLSDSTTGAVCGKLYRLIDSRPSNVIDSTGLFFLASKRIFGGCHWDNRDTQFEVFGATGACALYNRKMLDSVKIDGEYFDEDFFAYHEDVDLAWRAGSLGWKAVCAPNVIGYHYCGAAQKSVSQFVQNLAYRNRYFVLVKNDSVREFLKILPVFLIFEFLRHIKFLFISPRLVLQWPVIIKNIRRMLNKRRKIQQRKLKHANSS